MKELVEIDPGPVIILLFLTLLRNLTVPSVCTPTRVLLQGLESELLSQSLLLAGIM